MKLQEYGSIALIPIFIFFGFVCLNSWLVKEKTRIKENPKEQPKNRNSISRWYKIGSTGFKYNIQSYITVHVPEDLYPKNFALVGQITRTLLLTMLSSCQD